MSHVDEGALHAYLDGALDEYPAAEADAIRTHLDECGACRSRLEAERAVRQEASTILDLAAPEVEVPTFEELRAYVQATRPTPRPATRLYRMGWAASIVLAVGAGWMLRGGQVDVLSEARVASAPVAMDGLSGAAADAAPAAEAPARGFAQPGGAVATESFAEDVAAGARADRAVVVVEAPRQQQDAASEGLARTVTSAPAELQARPDPAATLEQGDRKAIGEEEPVARDENLARRATSVVVADADAAVDSGARFADDLARRNESTALALDEIVVTGSAADVGAGAAGFDSAGALGRSSTAEPENLVVDRAEAESRERAAPAPTAPVTAQLRVQGGQLADARDVDLAVEADAEEVVDDLPLVIPGLEVVSYAALAEGTAPSGLHIIQRLESGEILDIYHLPEGVEVSVLGPLEEGRSELVLLRQSGAVVLRAVATQAELVELAERWEPEG